MAAPQPTSIERLLAEEASARYDAHRDEMDSIRDKIDHNRKGEIKLSEITSDSTRKLKRVVREESMSVEISALERINGVPDFQDINIIRKIMKMSEAVGRILITKDMGSSGYGTGFLVHRNLMLTNNHVLPDVQTAANSRIQFNYEIQPDGSKSNPITFKIRPDLFFITSSYKRLPDDPGSGLDFTLVAVDEVSEGGKPVEHIQHARLDGETGKILEGENCVIIQHPKGDFKKIVLKDIRMINLVDDFIVYESDTLPGSSGSMVLGLGTGEIVALHHSAIPRKDENGNWLKKDGTVATPYDSDDEIDWIGNEGVRISRIIQRIREFQLQGPMDQMRNTFLSGIKGLVMESAPVSISPKPIAQPQAVQAASPTPRVKPQSTNAMSNSAETCYFEVQLVKSTSLQDDWEENASSFVPGFVHMEQIFEHLVGPGDPRIYAVEARCTDNPWISAELIERLPHVAYCVPDQPIHTDAMLDPGEVGEGTGRSQFESAGVYNTGFAQRNEEDFIRRWSNAKHIRGLDLNDDSGKELMRKWNFRAVNFADGIDGLTDKSFLPELNKLRIVQLDTGHSNLSKIHGGINHSLQYDFVDEDSRAIDELKRVGLKHPYHGTRTASIVIGGKLRNDIQKMDGNYGLLTTENGEERKAQAKVIPYRVANSVVLINRGKNILSAVEHGISINADVMFMCMGSLPSPSLDLAARKAYENGIIWVCAAGNEVEVIVAPATYPGTIAVAATNPDDRPWKGSSYGKMVDIAAPGEDVYVPFLDRNRDEIMVYGDGTSYATPHVASAAMLWKAKFSSEIRRRYRKPWMVVEAFRYCLSKTAKDKMKVENTEKTWNTAQFGEGILDITRLLSLKPNDLPNPEDLTNAYDEIKEWPALTSSSAVQAFRTLWSAVTRKINPWEPSGYESGFGLTESGQQALEALKRSSTGLKGASALESSGILTDHMAVEILRDYTEPYERNTPTVKPEIEVELKETTNGVPTN